MVFNLSQPLLVPS